VQCKSVLYIKEIYLMTKKLMTLAVATAFTGSAFAADVSVSGAQEWSWNESNGATTSALDGNFSVKATQELENGTTVAADINIAEDGANDGGASLTISGAFGKFDLGDTSSATDAIDDVTDWGYVLTNGSPNVDHAVLYTLPVGIEGLTVHVSTAADTNQDGNAAGTAYAARYDFGIAKVGYGLLENDDNTEATIMNVSGSIGGLGLGYEKYTDTTAAGVDTDNTLVSATYSVGATTFAVETYEQESAGTVSSDEITYGIHHDLGSNLVMFAEQTSDDKTPSEDTTAVGISFKF
jgi:hypothetical protein